ncbi:S41 family peptidase [Aquimarina sp. AU58]|uniref:S41 family peptidase n=1 Tax=Aquimarina sp. AU58 TaxID=1874112 RepID=UPI000D6DFE3E|nr:S41 family peptidase [Aquimarina sp. AU58]
MKQTVLQKSKIVIAFLFITTSFFAQSNNEIIKEAQKLLEKNYIFLDKAKEINAHLDALMEKGFFDNQSPKDFAKTLTQELRKITKDKHLRFLSPRPPEQSKKDTKASFIQNLSRYRPPMLRGFKLMKSNIGYIDLAFFGGSEEHLAKIDQVMNDMLVADAIIIDMRRNGGGSPTTVNYLSSYFFNEKLLLNTIYSRANDHTEELWVADVKGIKRPKVPVYILTSDYTFSGAEDFSYTMQSRGRATVIGEVTGGGAHPTRGFSLPNGFRIAIPFARTINPVTKTNWEGVGVQPDIKISASKALEKAKKLASAQAVTYRDSFFEPLEKTLTVIEKNKTTSQESKNDIYKQLVLLTHTGMINESEINAMGYYYLQNNNPQTALIIFESNTQLFPDSANAWDSLAESYLGLENKEKAIEYYEKAIEMDPKGGVGENARGMLKRIKSQ